MSRRGVAWGLGIFAVFVLLFLALTATFVVSETEQAVVIRLGKPVRIVLGDRTEEEWEAIEKAVEEYRKESGTKLAISRGPGLYLKTPFVDEVRKFDDRVIEYDAQSRDIVTRDKKHLKVDNFARWRIVNPLLLLQKVQTEAGARPRLDDKIYSALREHLSKADMVEIVRSTNDLLDRYPDNQYLDRIRFGREEIMERVTAQVDSELADLGIQVLDVRIKRADLLPENEIAVYGRMSAERKRISDKYRAEGNRELQKIQAETDYEVEQILATARKKAEVLLGEGEAEAAAIYAKAYEPHRDFYTFIRSLEALEKSVDEKTRIVIGADSSLFRYLKERVSDE